MLARGGKLMSGKPMPSTTESSLSDTLTPIQIRVLQCLVAGQSVTAAAKDAGLHRSTVHLWTRTHPDFARALLALRQNRADRLVDELGDLADLAINTFRQILSDEKAPAAARLKAAMEVVKLVESQRPTTLSTALSDPAFEKLDTDLRIAELIAVPAKPPFNTANTVGRNAACPCGSPLKYKRCCGNPVRQNRAA